MLDKAEEQEDRLRAIIKDQKVKVAIDHRSVSLSWSNLE
jgi:hypothetical protein